MPRRINCSRDITLECFTREQFCAAHNIGRTMYYELRKAGKGPNEIRLGSKGKVLITRESAAAWRAARDAEAAKAGEKESHAD
jgi:hypothetical protein